MTDVRWSKDAPKADGYYWAQFPDSTPFPRMRCAAWEHQEYDPDMMWGPRIPSPKVLAEVAEFLLGFETGGWSDSQARAAALLAKLSGDAP